MRSSQLYEESKLTRSRTCERFLACMTSQMAEEREARCLRLAFADASCPLAHVLAFMDANMLVMQVVDEGL